MAELQAGTEEGSAAQSGLGVGGCRAQWACPAQAHREAPCQVCANGRRLCGQENLQCEDTAKPKQRQPRHDFLSGWKGLSNRGFSGFLRAAEVWW